MIETCSVRRSGRRSAWGSRAAAHSRAPSIHELNATAEQEEDTSPSPKYAWQGYSDKSADKFPYEPTVVIDAEMQNADPSIHKLIKASKPIAKTSIFDSLFISDNIVVKS